MRLEDAAEGVTRQVGFVLLPGFSLLAQACALEPLHVANQLGGRQFYDLQTYGLATRAIKSMASLWVTPQHVISEAAALDMLFICAPPGPAESVAGQGGWLAELAERKIVLGGIAGGASLLARAGLLDGYRATLAWQESECRARPTIRVSRQLFEIDRDRLTCGGGTAAMDMMLTLIARHHGQRLASRVSEHFVSERVPMSEAPGTAARQARLGHAPQSLFEATALMEANIEEPLTTHELAEHLGVSRRQLERLFKKYLQAVPSRYYLDLRLQRARRLIRGSDKPLGEIALQTGFSSAAHFSTAYRNHFGMSPREERLI